MDKIDKEFEKLVPLPEDTDDDDDEFRLDKKKGASLHGVAQALQP
jgi:hypothetical protein